jgi:hypothetical protein
MRRADAMNRTRCKPHAGVVASFHDDGLVLMDVRHGRLFTANRCGARIWRALEESSATDTIATALSREYGIALDAAKQHSERFIADLAAHGLVQAEDPQ